MKNELFSNKQMNKITGETKQRIQYWILKGVFHPADEGGGTGTSRRYSFANLLEILIAQTLSPILNNVTLIVNILNEIRKKYPTFFKESAGRRKDARKNILSVLIGSENTIMVYVHNVEEATVSMSNYVSEGFKCFHMDLDYLKTQLIEKIGRI